MIIFDFSQILHNNLFLVKEDIEKEGMERAINFLKHRMLNQILKICNKYPTEREIILASDYGSWRKQVIPYYKERRKIRRKNDSFDMTEFFNVFSEFEESLEKYFPFNFIKIKRVEGDDIVGALTYHIYENYPNEKIIIVSNDKDFKQLHFSNRIRQFDPREKKEIKAVNYKNELMWLIIKGDDSDDIPNIRTSDLDVFINVNKKQKKCWRSNKIWECIHNNTVFEELLNTDELKKNFERNKKAIDLREIPEDIKKSIIEKYEKNREDILTRKKMSLMKYLVKHKLKMMLTRIDEFSDFYKFNEENVQDIDSFF